MSAGLVLLINEFYIYGCEILASSLCSVFYLILILKLGYFPAKWSMGLISMIIPLHKKGDDNCVKNYMGNNLIEYL